MKSSAVLSVAVSLFLMLASCSNSDDGGSDEVIKPDSHNIVGHWVSSKRDSYDSTTGETSTLTGKHDNIDMALFENGSCIHNTMEGTYNLVGNELFLKVSRYDDFIKREISTTYNYYIEEFSANKMKIRYKPNSSWTFYYYAEKVQ